jgi:Tol biopolymer transport system component
MNQPIGVIALGMLMIGCTSAPSSTAPSAVPAAVATAVATGTPGPTPEASLESLVYPVADGEEWILFDAPANDPGEPESHDALFLVRPDGSGLHRLVHEMTGSEVRATWSPDGTQVAYIQTRWPSDSWDQAGLYVVEADGSNPHRVFQCAAWCNTMDYPDWGSDGAIYVSIDSNVPDPNSPPLTFEVWRIDPATGEGRAVLTREDAMTVEQPRVSPDASQLVYARERIADGKWAIFAADMVVRAEQQLTDWNLYAAYPDWSADGLISFNTNDLRVRNDQPHEVCTQRVAGVPPRNPDCIETRDPEAPAVAVQAAHARWMPDGRGMTYSLLLRGGAYLSMMNHDGSDQRLVPGPVWGAFSELRPVAS